MSNSNRRPHKSRPVPVVRFGNRVGRQLTARFRGLPDFVIIGARKAGTTALYRYLSYHPSIRFASHKEVHFFDTGFERGVNWYRAHFPIVSPRPGGGRRKPLPRPTLGEASPYYLFHPAVPERLHSLLPQARLVAVLRNPVDRAYSQYYQAACSGRETLSFEEAIEREPERLGGEGARVAAGRYSVAHRHQSYVARGHYAEQLERWFERFPRDQFLILESGELADRPAETMERVLNWLGLPVRHGSHYRKCNAFRYAPMEPSTRRQLMDYFRPLNERLYSLLGERYDWDG